MFGPKSGHNNSLLIKSSAPPAVNNKAPLTSTAGTSSYTLIAVGVVQEILYAPLLSRVRLGAEIRF